MELPFAGKPREENIHAEGLMEITSPSRTILKDKEGISAGTQGDPSARNS